jgi:rod shape-determining protein MreC
MVRRTTRRKRLLPAQARAWAAVFNVIGQQSYLVYFVIAMLLMAGSVMQFAPLEKMRMGVVDGVAPVLAQVGTPIQSMVQNISDLSGLTAIKAENARLEQENGRLRDWYQTAQLLKAENAALRKLLKAQADPNASFVTARVLADPSSVYVRALLVNAGKAEAVQPDQPVMTGEGLLGRVAQVGNKVSRVLLLTDINSRLPVVIESTGHRAVAAGQNTNMLRLELLPEDIKIDPGMRVVTSGDGGIFPAGLPVGEIASVRGRDIEVRPFAPMEASLFVQIMNTGFDALKSDILFEQQIQEDQ